MTPKKNGNGWTAEKPYVLEEVRGLRKDFNTFKDEHTKCHQDISRWQGKVDGKLGIWGTVILSAATIISFLLK